MITIIITIISLSWMAVFNGVSAAGTAQYFPNGTLITYDLNGKLLNKGYYTITEGPTYCYEYETYIYPPDAADTCNSFYIDQEQKSMIGCEILQDNCKPITNCTDYWNNWYAARFLNYL